MGLIAAVAVVVATPPTHGLMPLSTNGSGIGEHIGTGLVKFTADESRNPGVFTAAMKSDTSTTTNTINVTIIHSAKNDFIYTRLVFIESSFLSRILRTRGNSRSCPWSYTPTPNMEPFCDRSLREEAA